MTPLRFLLLLITSAILTSCASEPPTLPDEPIPGAKLPGSHKVELGTFTDARKLPPNYLGMINAKPGGEKQKLETSMPVSEIVARGFGHGLASQGWAAEVGLPSHWTMSGEIKEFTCERFQTAGAILDIVVKLTKTGETQAAYSKSFTAEKASPTAVEPTEMQALADSALQQVVTSVMRDAEFLQVVSSH